MLSLFFKHKLLQSRFATKVDQFFNILVAIILFSIFIVVYNALQRPVNTMQYQQVIYFSQQASHPRTQHMAIAVLRHSSIRRVDYLKLLNAYQFESNRIKQYPAMKQEDE